MAPLLPMGKVPGRPRALARKEVTPVLEMLVLLNVPLYVVPAMPGKVSPMRIMLKAVPSQVKRRELVSEVMLDRRQEGEDLAH